MLGEGSQSLLTSAATNLTAQQQNDDLLDLADVAGKRIISTRLHGSVTIREENSIAALEVMSRFAANPKWLIYLPPTMSPCETSQAPGLLEHPAEAFAYFRHAGVPRVVCEEKHMGSRAVVVICRDEDAARKTFGVTGEGIGICYTRTGRRFFDNAILEAEFLEHVRTAATTAGFWDEFKTDWFCLEMVVKPLDFIAKSRRGIVQPGVKCRGREYLRIIYGPEYTAAENLERLRARGLSTKRSLALREFALGIESLERFVRKEPLRRVHEAVFGVLALESEPVDPRL